MKASKKIALGPTGRTVAANVKRLRGAMQYKELAERLEAVGRPIPVLGLRRIEAEERRVDADDLAALAAVLGVSPTTLLMPYSNDAAQPVSITGSLRPTSALRAWLWLQADIGLTFRELSVKSHSENNWFRVNARPPWEVPEGEWRPWGDGDVRHLSVLGMTLSEPTMSTPQR